MPDQYARKVRAIHPDLNVVFHMQIFSSQQSPPAWHVLPGRLLAFGGSHPRFDEFFVEPPWRVEEEIDGQWVPVANSDDRSEKTVWLIWPQSAAVEWIEYD